MSSLKEDVLNCSKLYSIEATFSSKAWESTGSTEMFPQYAPSAHSQAVRHQQLAWARSQARAESLEWPRPSVPQLFINIFLVGKET